MRPEILIMIVSTGFLAVIVSIVIIYVAEKKKDAKRQEKALLRGWRYESAKSNQIGFKVKGCAESTEWKLEERRGKDQNRPLIFVSTGVRYGYGVFYFGNKSEVDLLNKPFMQYILKLGAKIAPQNSDSARVEALSLLKDAQSVEIQQGAGDWKYGCLATHPDFAYKVIGGGIRAEFDSLSLIKTTPLPPSIMLTPEGLEIKWPSRNISAEKMEQIIDSSVRMMEILKNSLS